jgi:transmembrane sensor
VPDIHRFYMTDDELWLLLHRHASGNASDEDANRLRTWVEQDPSRAAMVRHAEDVVAASRCSSSSNNDDESWSVLRDRIARDPATRTLRFRLSTVMGRRGRGFIRKTAIAAGVLVAVGVTATALGRSGFFSGTTTVAEREYRTARGERAEIVLSDGSKVTLSAASRLVVPVRFGDRREVRLEGEAYFDLKHDPERTFIVNAGSAAAQAVGTKFAVRGYEGDTTVRVVVAEGRVLLRGRDGAAGSGSILNLGDLGEMNLLGTTATIRHGVRVEDYLGWLHSTLVYRGTPMSVVAADFERWYDTELSLSDSALAAARVTVVLTAGQPDEAGRLLAEVLGARYERVGPVIKLSRSAR